jgi:hypothetical protein
MLYLSLRNWMKWWLISSKQESNYFDELYATLQ